MYHPWSPRLTRRGKRLSALPALSECYWREVCPIFMTLTLCLSIGRRLPPTHPFVVSMVATPEEGRVLYSSLARSFLHLAECFTPLWRVPFCTSQSSLRHFGEFLSAPQGPHSSLVSTPVYRHTGAETLVVSLSFPQNSRVQTGSRIVASVGKRGSQARCRTSS